MLRASFAWKVEQLAKRGASWLERLKARHRRAKDAGTDEPLKIERTHTGTYVHRLIADETGEYCSHCPHCQLLAARRLAKIEREAGRDD
jgi:hypothetical protein